MILPKHDKWVMCRRNRQNTYPAIQITIEPTQRVTVDDGPYNVNFTCNVVVIGEDGISYVVFMSDDKTADYVDRALGEFRNYCQKVQEQYVATAEHDPTMSEVYKL